MSNSQHIPTIVSAQHTMRAWIRTHWAESSTEDSKWYYLFPTEDDNQTVGVFCIEEYSCYQGAARFYDHGGLASFPNDGNWHRITKNEAVEIWKNLVDSGKYYHYDPKVDL